jgi:hypothetical protein
MSDAADLNATVVASMRNEGPFIVEWLCWYRMLGFARALVVTNGCTDRSPQLLDALAAAGWAEHLVHEVRRGQRITRAKLKAARRHPAVTKADMVFVCDVDEFLVIHCGAGRLADLIAAVPPFLGMAIHWRIFGSDGQQAFVDAPVHRQFFTALGPERNLSGFIKTLYRHPRWFAEMGEHGPRRYKPHKAAFGAGEAIWVSAGGQVVPQWQPEGDYVRFLPAEVARHVGAQVNHYMIRSEESFSLKAGTLAPVSLTPRYDAAYHDRAMRRDARDVSALRYEAAFDAVWAEAMALPGVRRLHHLCCADHLTAIALKAGRDPAGDPRIAAHLALAE